MPDLREFKPDPTHELQRERAELRRILIEIREARRKLFTRGIQGEREAYARLDAISAALGGE